MYHWPVALVGIDQGETFTSREIKYRSLKSSSPHQDLLASEDLGLPYNNKMTDILLNIQYNQVFKPPRKLRSQFGTN